MMRPIVAPTLADLQIIKDARLHGLAVYWLSVRGQTAVPERRLIDATAFPVLLPFVWLIEREAASGRYRFRLAGEEMNALMHTNLRGRYLDDLLDRGDLAHGITLLDRVLDTPAIAYCTGRSDQRGARRVDGERLVLPLREGAITTMVMGATLHQWEGERGPGILPAGEDGHVYLTVG